MGLKSLCNHFFTKAVDQPSESASVGPEQHSATVETNYIYDICKEFCICCTLPCSPVTLNTVLLTLQLQDLTPLTHHTNRTWAHAHSCTLPLGRHLPSTCPSCVRRSEELAGHALARGEKGMLSGYLLS